MTDLNEVKKYLDEIGAQDVVYISQSVVRELIARVEAAESGMAVSGVVIRDGQPTLIQDKHIKPTDGRLYTRQQQAPEWLPIIPVSPVTLTDHESVAFNLGWNACETTHRAMLAAAPKVAE